MKKIALFTFLGLLSFAFASPSVAAVTCRATSAAVVEGNACSQLGETRMLADYSGIVACVVKDKTQTGEIRDCNWSNMSSSGGLPGSLCGMMSIVRTTTTGTAGDDARDYSYSDCGYTYSVKCNGKNPAIMRETAATGYTRICQSSFYTSGGMGGMMATSIRRSLNDLYYMATCPSGYTFSKVIDNYYSCVKN